MSSELKNRWIAIEKLWDQINIYDGPDTFLSTSSAAGQPAALLYAAHFAESEICNGGFKQQFSNSTGILSPEAVQGFQLIGITRQHRYSSPQLKHWATLSLVNEKSVRRFSRAFQSRLSGISTNSFSN
jgi:hypothetical protein